MINSDVIKIMLADDHVVVRKGFVAYLNLFANELNIIGEANNGEELLTMVKVNIPDIVLLDLEMPVKNGFETLAVLIEKYRTVKTIILSSHFTEFLGTELIALGARAYLRKNCEPEELIDTIRKVSEEGYYFNKDISKHLVKHFVKQKEMDDLIKKNLLSERELEVIRLICEGKTYKEAAEILFISKDTVKFHQGRIYKKIHVNTQSDLIKYAIRVGITSAFETNN